jgi:hypothetical protein
MFFMSLYYVTLCSQFDVFGGSKVVVLLAIIPAVFYPFPRSFLQLMTRRIALSRVLLGLIVILLCLTVVLWVPSRL